MKLLLRPFSGQYDDSRGGKTTEFHMNEYLPFALHTGVGFSDPICLPIESHTLQARLARLINHSQVRTASCWEKSSSNSSVALLTAIMQVSTWYLCAWGRCVGVRRAMAIIGGARQASSEGKSGPVETGLTGPAATALQLLMLCIGILSFTH